MPIMKTSEVQLHDFFEDFADPFVSFDKEYRFAYLNTKAAEMFGKKREELIGKNIVEEFGSKLTPEVVENAVDAFNTQKTRRVEVFSNLMQCWLEIIFYPSQSGVSVFFRDITEQKNKEIGLKQIELNYRSMIDQASDAIMITDRTGQFHDANTYFCKLFGYTSEEIKNLHISKVIDPEQLKNEPIRFDLLMAGHSVLRERRMLHKDGTFIDVEANVKKLPDGRLLAIARDIRERKIIEKALIESELRFKSIAENTPVGIGCCNSKGEISYINSTFTHISGYTVSDLPTIQTWSQLAYPDEKYRAYVTSLFQRDLELYKTNQLDKISKIQVDICCKNGETKHVELLRTFGEDVIYFILNDITKRKKAQDELLKSRRTLRELSSHLQNIREDERSSIAREVHDELGQQLTGLKMDLSMLNKKTAVEDKVAREKIAGMIALVDDTVKTVRRIATELRPGILDDIGLTAALDWQSNEFEKRTGIHCKFATELNEIPIEKNLATGVFRVYQEALTNITRHANATLVETSFGMVDDNIVLQVHDNGAGFDSEKVKQKNSLGLIGMKERAIMFDGELNINSEEGRGTTITLQVPMKIDIK